MTITETRTWQLSWGDHIWTEADVTGAHAALIALIGRADSFEMLDPLSGPMALMANIAAFVALAESRDVVAVMAELAAASLEQLLAAVSMV